MNDVAALLADSCSDPEGRREAEILLACALGRGRAWLRAHPDCRPTPEETDRFATMWRRRTAGEPVAYIVGRREFWSLDLEVGPAVLIPRPETELLVELALAALPADRPCRVADLGTGSGAVALAIAAGRPRAVVVAVDIAAAAVALARANAERLSLANLSFVVSDWFSALGGERFDLVVSNPPYVAAGDPHLGRGDLRFEPRRALVAGEDGLDALRAIAAAAPDHLQPGGHLLVEHGCDQGAAVRDLMAGRGLTGVGTGRDLAGLERVTYGVWAER